MTSIRDPFKVLGLAPTLDHAAIKRAYFGMLSRHTPHEDPEGFRRVRDAYELLMGPGLADAWAAAEVDVDLEFDALEHELGPRITEAKRAAEAARACQFAVRSFEALLRLDLASANASVTPLSPAG